MRKSLLGLLILVLALSTVVSAKSKNITLRWVIFAQQDIDYFTNKNNLAKAYKKYRSNVNIELELVKDSGDFENAMKIRKSAGELPEIIPLKPYMLADFADALAPLDGISAAKKNIFAKEFTIDGKIVALPLNSFNEFVFYRKDIFKEYNLGIPKTWDEFIATAEKIKAGKKYIPIIMGAKDVWPVYPFNEFMPCLEAGNGRLWNQMAAQDDPFDKDKPFYKAYAKIKRLYDAKVFGEDALGIGFDSAKGLFASGKGAMLCAGQWFIPQYSGDLKNVGAFLLPVRNNANDTLNTIAMADSFLATPKHNQYLKETKAFLNWLFSSAYYNDYINSVQLTPTVRGVNSNIPMLREAFAKQKVKFILYDGGNADFSKISDHVRFDVKRLGQEMILGKDLDRMMNDLNKAWQEARAKVIKG